MPSTLSTCATLILMFVSAPRLPGQGVLLEFVGAEEHDGLGEAIENVGDLDGDGVDDLLVSSLRTRLGSLPAMVQAFSGRTGVILYTALAANPREQFGRALSRASDVNGDGIQDVAIGSRGSHYFGVVGRAVMLSGADGSLIWSYAPPSLTDAGFGDSIDARADVDGDSVADPLVGGGALGGNLMVLSGLNGIPIREFSSRADSQDFGLSVTYVGDLDLDGVVDCAASDPHYVVDGSIRGEVYIYSGATGRLIRILSSETHDFSFGRALADLGDVDIDGLSDLAAGGSGGFFDMFDQVEVRSGLNGSVLHTHSSGDTRYPLRHIIATPDVDSDGTSDLLIPTFGLNNPALLSGRTGKLIHVAFDTDFNIAGAVIDQNLDGVLDYALAKHGHSIPGGRRLGRVQVINGRCGSIESYADPCIPTPNSYGLLWLEGRAIENDAVTLGASSFSEDPDWQYGVLVLGARRANYSLGGPCWLSVRPDVIQPVVLRGRGHYVAAEFPDRIPVGFGPTSLFLQMILDYSVSPGVTNALRIDVP